MSLELSGPQQCPQFGLPDTGPHPSLVLQASGVREFPGRLGLGWAVHTLWDTPAFPSGAAGLELRPACCPLSSRKLAGCSGGAQRCAEDAARPGAGNVPTLDDRPRHAVPRALPVLEPVMTSSDDRPRHAVPRALSVLERVRSSRKSAASSPGNA